MNKYYTPKLEELYVGYQYEWLTNGEWIVSYLVYPESIMHHHLTNMENIRTRYLDREDLESLGFKYNSEVDKDYNNSKIFDWKNYNRFTKEWPDYDPNISISDGYKGYYDIYVPKDTVNYNCSLHVYPILISIYMYGGFAGEVKKEIVYKGLCPSINELTQLMKLLKMNRKF